MQSAFTDSPARRQTAHPSPSALAGRGGGGVKITLATRPLRLSLLLGTSGRVHFKSITNIPHAVD